MKNHKVKVFAGYGTQEVEASINQWLGKNENIKITSISQIEHKTMDCAVIIAYSEKKEGI